jgi:hypothetical protein
LKRCDQRRRSRSFTWTQNFNLLASPAGDELIGVQATEAEDYECGVRILRPPGGKHHDQNNEDDAADPHSAIGSESVITAGTPNSKSKIRIKPSVLKLEIHNIGFGGKLGISNDYCFAQVQTQDTSEPLQFSYDDNNRLSSGHTSPETDAQESGGTR